MRIIKKMLKQKAVLWGFTGETDDFNRPKYTVPQIIRCRWEEMTEQIVDGQGRALTTRARAFTEIDIKEGSALLLLPKGMGLANLTDTANPFNNPEVGQAWEVKRFDKFPTMNAKQFLRTAFM